MYYALGLNLFKIEDILKICAVPLLSSPSASVWEGSLELWKACM